MSIMEMVYQAGLNNGLSSAQARAFTAEVGRENDFQPQYIFGEHRDSNRDNVGIISWNQGRRTNLYKYLASRGIPTKGGIERSQRALDAQMGFALQEIRTNPSYKATKRLFLDNPNVDYRTAERVLGKNFIRWDYVGNSLGANVKKHHAKRDKYYAQLGGIVKDGGNQGVMQQAPLSNNWDEFKAQFEPQEAPPAIEPLSDNWDDFKSSLTASAAPQPEMQPLSDNWESFKGSLEPSNPPQAIEPLSNNWDEFKSTLAASSNQTASAPTLQQTSAIQPPTLTIDERRTING